MNVLSRHALTFYWGAVSGYALLTLWLMCAPRPLPEMPSASYASELGHFVIFGGMAGILALAMRQTWPELSRRILFWVPALGASAYGLVLETTQYFIPNRTFDIVDIVLNIAGAFTVQMLLLTVIWRDQTASSIPQGDSD